MGEGKSAKTRRREESEGEYTRASSRDGPFSQSRHFGRGEGLSRGGKGLYTVIDGTAMISQLPRSSFLREAPLLLSRSCRHRVDTHGSKFHRLLESRVQQCNAPSFFLLLGEGPGAVFSTLSLSLSSFSLLFLVFLVFLLLSFYS